MKTKTLFLGPFPTFLNWMICSCSRFREFQTLPISRSGSINGSGVKKIKFNVIFARPNKTLFYTNAWISAEKCISQLALEHSHVSQSSAWSSIHSAQYAKSVYGGCLNETLSRGKNLESIYLFIQLLTCALLKFYLFFLFGCWW